MDLELFQYNKELEFVNSTVFLGITLDDRLQWGPHIISIMRQVIHHDPPRATWRSPRVSIAPLLRGGGSEILNSSQFRISAEFVVTTRIFPDST
ncbi:hypothetical protein EVAR_76514_1 [Eumeta japonica]|uniref:Uncharacterized protein n=1 Tax=Eumeta variegata TaxID=151549 RepID=A0A4C1T4N8_EUMVA|nr:hypothetical protein EVAR_76514_1 [Eumeta japonica]